MHVEDFDTLGEHNGKGGECGQQPNSPPPPPPQIFGVGSLAFWPRGKTSIEGILLIKEFGLKIKMNS
jgi:hypothetical protein